MSDLLIRFVIGGVVVSLFAVIGDILKPKSFAGLFGAAPSVALATLSLAVLSDGKEYAATEAKSMIGGAGAFLIYAFVCSWILMKYPFSALKVTSAGLILWLIVA